MTTKICEFAKILAFELDDNLIASNLRTDVNGNYRMDVRVRFRYVNGNMSDEQKLMYEKLSEKQRKIIDKLGRNDTYTCLFPALDLLDEETLGADNLKVINEMLSSEGIDEDTQKAIFAKVVEYCKDGSEFIQLPFTTYVVPITDVLKDTEYQFGVRDGKKFEFTTIHSKTRGYSSVSRSYFGVHSDIENATNGIIRRTLSQLDNGTYSVGNNDHESELLAADNNTSETTAKPKLTL